MKYADIPQFTRASNYQIDLDWEELENWISRKNRALDAPNDKYCLELEPEFQRGHVWDEAKQIRYVEFILRGGETGKDIYFNCSSFMQKMDTAIQLVDGLQRLTAVRRFLNNEIPSFGIYHKDFEERHIPSHARFRIHIHDLKKYKQVLQWYVELNEGGIIHTPEEIDRVKKMIERENHPV